MTGKEMCGLSKEEFCSRAPVFVGDILWEHLVLLQQDVDREKAALKNAPSTLSEISTEPVSLPPSPPRQQSLYPVPHSVSHSVSNSVSPQKTYHTLSPQHYTTPSPPLAYTNLETSAPPVIVKSEYPSPGQQYQYQYHPYQRLPQPYQHYSYPPTLYEMGQSGGPQYYHQSSVPVERWSQQPTSYQVTRIISHY